MSIIKNYIESKRVNTDESESKKVIVDACSSDKRKLRIFHISVNMIKVKNANNESVNTIEVKYSNNERKD